MDQRLPPSGTRGGEIPGFARPLIRAMSVMQRLMVRTGMKVQGLPLLLLTTVGARTGRTRKAVLAFFTDGDRRNTWLIVGTNAGAVRHPGWTHNLVEHPEANVRIGSATIPITSRLVEGPERDAIWEEMKRTAPGYDRYETKTDRQFPIFRLTSR